MGFSLLVCGFELEWKMCSVRFRNHQTQKRVDKVGFNVKAAAASELSLSGFVGDSSTTESLSQNVREKNFTLCIKCFDMACIHSTELHSTLWCEC